MPNQSRKPEHPERPPRRSRDSNVLAFQVVAELTGTAEIPAAEDKPQKDPAAVSLGRRGGLKGGLARAAKMTPKERAESARKAAVARWGTR